MNHDLSFTLSFDWIPIYNELDNFVKCFIKTCGKITQPQYQLKPHPSSHYDQENAKVEIMFYDAQLKAHSHFLTKHIWLFPPSLLFILGMTDSMFFIPFSCHHGLAIWLLWISYDNYISIKLARSFSTWYQIVFAAGAK